MKSSKWLNCRLRDLQAYLTKKAHCVCLPVISRLLREHDYSLRANRKEEEGKSPVDRDAQFEYLKAQREQFVQAAQPVLSVDTKKKELLGDFKNAGVVWSREA